MILKSFGCSLIYGSELSDHNGVENTSYDFSRLTWPALISQKLNFPYVCHARPGSGNLQIAEQILTQLANNEIACYVIGWSFIDRFDYIDTNKPNEWDKQTPWQTVMPGDNTERGKVYYRDLHSEMRDKLTTLMSIKLIIDTLQQKNCPFIMTYIDDLTFDQRWHTTPAITALQEYILPHMSTFAGDTFINFAKKNGYPITRIGHPLDEAHAAASDLMLKVFDTQNTNVR